MSNTRSDIYVLDGSQSPFYKRLMYCMVHHDSVRRFIIGAAFIVRDADADAVKLGGREDEVTAVLVAIEADMVQVLDPEAYETVLLKKPAFLHADAGSDVCVIKTAEGLFLLP